MYPEFPNPIWWQAGQFLDPQHFQETDRFHSREARLALELARPYAWGVRALQVNADALVNSGMLKFDHAEFILPDGTYIRWTGRLEDGNAYSLHCPLETLGPLPEEGVVVRALLQNRREKDNAATGALEAPAKTEHDGPKNGSKGQAPTIGVGRFIPVTGTRETHDQLGTVGADSINPVPLTRLYYNIRLVAAAKDEPEAGFSSLPLVKLIKGKTGFSLDDAFMPPLFSFAANAGAGAAVDRLEKALLAFPGRLAEAEPADAVAKTASLFTRQAAAGLLAELSVQKENPHPHPYDLFAVLKRRQAELASAASMTGAGAPAATPSYDHANPSGWLPPLVELCEELLADNLPRIVACIEPVYDTDNTMLRFPLPEAARTNRRFILLLPAGEPLHAALQQGRLVAGSPDNVRKALRLALPEVRLRPVPAPGGLPSAPGNEYAAVDAGSDPWRTAVAAGEFAVVYYPEPVQSPETLTAKSRLYILGGRGE